MEKQRGGDHDELIEEFDYITTDPDGILKVLESILGDFEAKRLLSVLFQVYVVTYHDIDSLLITYLPTLVFVNAGFCLI